jgi:hypothetical protein
MSSAYFAAFQISIVKPRVSTVMVETTALGLPSSVWINPWTNDITLPSDQELVFVPHLEHMR